MTKKQILKDALERIKTVEPNTLKSYYAYMTDPYDAWNMDIKLLESFIDEVDDEKL